MIGDVSGTIPVLPVVLAGLLLFGIGYNLLVAWLIRHGYAEGYTWALVAGGVTFTLGGLAILDPQAAMLAMLAFACSGAPMSIGAWWRHVRQRKTGQDAQRHEALR